MGCTASEQNVIESNPRKTKFRQKGNSSYMPGADSYFENEDEGKGKPIFSKEQLDIIAKFNSNFSDSNGIQISTLSKYQLISSQENTSIISVSTNQNYIKCLKEINPIEANLNENPKFNLFKNSMKKTNSENTSYLDNYQISVSQKIYQTYNFVIRLKSVLRNKFDVFEFNMLEVPILIIFFDILSYPAIVKIKEIEELREKSKKEDKKDFLFLPIMNLYTNEKDDLSQQKEYLKLSGLKDCYVLTNKINSEYLRLFQLDTITSAKVVMINYNSEISYISNDQIEYLTPEKIKYYLFTLNVNNTFDYFTEESKNKVTQILQTDKFYKERIEKLKHEFLIEILFHQNEDRKHPVHINISMDYKDSEVMNEIINRLKQDATKYVKKFFLSVNEVKKLKTEMIEAFNYINNLLIEKGIESTSDNFELNTGITTYTKLIKKKKYLLVYKLKKGSEKKFSLILDIFSSNLYNNPQFAKLNIGYSIIPQKDVKLNLSVKNCKVVKLFTKKEDQISYEDNNKFQTIEVKDEFVLMINPNYFISSEENKSKVISVLKKLSEQKLSFTIVVFSYNEIDAQKLRMLGWDEVLEKEGKNNKIQILFLCSSELVNYSYFQMYIEDVMFYLFHIDTKEKKLIRLFDISKAQIEFVENYITTKKEATEATINSKMIQEIKTQVNQKILFKLCDFDEKLSNKIFAFSNYSSYYEKILSFVNKASFSNFEDKYQNYNFHLKFKDTLKTALQIPKIEKEVSQIKKKNFSYIIKEVKTEKIKIPSVTGECDNCKGKIQFQKEAFYSCLECKNKIFLCEKCFDGISYGKKEKVEEDSFFASFVMKKEEEEKKEWTHGHPLVYFDNYASESPCDYMVEVYNKYKNLQKKSAISFCPFCEGYIYGTEVWLNVFLSHFSKENESNNMEREGGELFICDNCLEKKLYIKYKNEYFKDILLIMKVELNKKYI